MGSRILRRLQLGQEVTPGTPVAATTIWGGPADSIEDTTEIQFVQQDVGRLSSGLRSYTSKQGAQYEMPEVEATFQQLAHIFQAAFGPATANSDGTGSAKIRDYALPMMAAITPKTYTLEGGDDTQAYYMPYSFVPTFKIVGKLGAAVTVSATWVGRQRLKRAFTPGLSVPTNLSVVQFGYSKLYIDDAGASLGATQKTGTFLGFELDVETGLVARFAADGHLYFSRVQQGVPSASLKVTFEHDQTGVDEQDKWLAEALRLLRIQIDGPALATPGTLYQKQALIFDMAGKWEKFSKLGEDNGVDIVSGTLRVGDDGTNFLHATLVNEDVAIP